MDEKTTVDPVETTKTEKTAKTKRPLWQKIVAGVVLFVVAVFILVSIAARGAVKVSNEFLSNIQNRQAGAAYALFSNEAAAATPRDEFNKIVDRIGPLLNTKADMKSKEVQGETGSSATSTVVYEIKGTDGVTYEVTVNLVKEDGEWKVVNFDSSAK
jgi:ABC-type transporter MlaC component